jgi:site-specific recombinase XerD
VRVYDLRHTYASRLVQQGVGLERIQLLLGHASYATSQIYAHLIPTDDFDEVRAALSTSVTAARAETTRLRAI